MILRWQLAVYWYAIIILSAFLILLMTPNKLNVSAHDVKNSDKRIESLADQSLKAKTPIEKAAINRRANRERSTDTSKTSNQTLNLLPFKVLLILIMAVFTYLSFAHVWKKQVSRQLRKKSV